jgi:YVTN family beta-propeller protein
LAKIATVKVGDYPEGMQPGPDGRFIYVSNWDSNTVSIIDARTLAVAGSMDGGSSPRAFGTFIRP